VCIEVLKNKSYHIVRFSKDEINRIMKIYSQKIAIGEWKDYSICFQKNYALFCIHKSFLVSPEFEILKKNHNSQKYTLSSRSRIIIKSASLKKVLQQLMKPTLLLVK
tara:strand:+ start:2460 stop:2780 length:321 start_codon:yes stop_codon:yes gene_type:complete